MIRMILTDLDHTLLRSDGSISDHTIDMLRICGKGIAVSNAIKEVLDMADEVTSSNDEDGVASWIERSCL